MGASDGELGSTSKELPQHQVTITYDYFMMEFEVTQELWLSLMGNNPAFYSECGLDCPVEQVSWWEAVKFANIYSVEQGVEECYELSGCSGLPGLNFECVDVTFMGLDCEGYRLPTEAEWERAARAGTLTATYNGDLPDITTKCSSQEVLESIAWYDCNSPVDDYPTGSTHPVGEKDPNDYGLYDMLGNVAEVVWDWNAEYEGDALVDPLGPDMSENDTKLLRGSSATDKHSNTRAAKRGTTSVTNRWKGGGFRLVQTAK